MVRMDHTNRQQHAQNGPMMLSITGFCALGPVVSNIAVGRFQSHTQEQLAVVGHLRIMFDQLVHIKQITIKNGIVLVIIVYPLLTTVYYPKKISFFPI